MGVATFMLFMAIGPALAGESWEFSSKKCHMQKRFFQDESGYGGTFFHSGENEATVTIDAGEIEGFEKAAAALRKCVKFWRCNNGLWRYCDRKN
jgi:hypothetical protein